MEEQKMIGKMMERPSWLRYRDLKFVKSVSRQLEEGKRTEPSFKQAMVIREIYKRWQKAQEPRIFVSGTPGNGRR